MSMRGTTWHGFVGLAMSPVLLLSLFFFSLELGLGLSRDEEHCSGTYYQRK